MNKATGEVDLAVQAFESAWESGVVRDFVSSIPEDAVSNTELLTELACIDLQYRVQHDVETRVETYTNAFPQLAQDDLVMLELIRTEYSFRADRDSLDAAVYSERFPHLARQIAMMFQLEFHGSDIAHTRAADANWHCLSCNAAVAGRETGETSCRQCGKPIAIGRYELLERVGEGAFGYVYRARDPKLDREVAIKLPRSSQFLMPEESERFLRESRNAAQLDHPGIVRVFDSGRQDGVPYIVCEFVDGQPLSSLLANREFDFRQAAGLVAEIANAVAHAHQRGVIHRDLKPSNIMTGVADEHLKPRVMDFGLARRNQSDTTVTIEGQAIGTPAYMSPEQARGDLAEVDQRSDVYSLGVILYQLLSGEVPFRGNVPMLIQQVINDDPQPPSRFRIRIPRDLETICMKAILREPASRYADVQALAGDLERWLQGIPIQARRIGPAGRMGRWCKRRPTVAALLATLAIAVVAGMAGITWQWRQAEAARMASEADLSDALESVDRVLEHLGSDTLVDIPQAKQLRADVLDDALLFFQRFRQRNPDDPRIAMQVARAHHKVARIQQALGKTEEAETAYEAATQGYRKLQDRAPDRQEWQVQTAAAYSGHASFLRQQSQLDEAQQRQVDSLNLYRQLYEEHPQKGEYAARYATAQADLGRILTDADAVEAAYDSAIDHLQALVLERDRPAYKQDLARVLNNYSIYLTRVGQHGQAESCRGQAIQLLEDVIADDPEDESKRALYASCCLQLGKSLRGESRLTAAREYQEKAVAAYQRLTEDFPATPRHRDRFASVLREAGSLAAVQDRTPDQLQAYQEAVRQRQMLVALFPSRSNYQRSLAEDLGNLAGTLISLDQLTEAEDRLREKLDIQRQSASTESVRDTVQLVIGIRDLAALLAKSSAEAKQQETEALRREAAQLMADIDVEQIMEAQLSNSSKRSLLSSLVSLARKEDDVVALEKYHRAKIELYLDVVNRDPTRPSRRSELARQWASLGQTLRQLDRKEDAITAYRNAIDIDESLLQDDPQSATYTTQLISHSSALGAILIHSGDPGEGARVIRRSLDLARNLFEERQNEGFRQVRVVMAYYQLGTAMAVENMDPAGALAAFDEAVSMADILREQPGMQKFEAVVLNSAAWFLVTCPDETLRDPSRARQLARRAVAIGPDNGNHISTLALALYQIGDYQAAIEHFERSSELGQDLAPLNTLLIALAQAKSGQLDAAKASYTKAVRLNESNAAEPELFQIYQQQAEPILLEDESN